MDSSTSGDDFIADFFDLFDLSWLESSTCGEIESQSFGSNKRSFLISLAQHLPHYELSLVKKEGLRSDFHFQVLCLPSVLLSSPWAEAVLFGLKSPPPSSLSALLWLLSNMPAPETL